MIYCEHSEIDICPLLDPGDMSCGKKYKVRFDTKLNKHYSENCAIDYIHISGINFDEYYSTQRTNHFCTLDLDVEKLPGYSNDRPPTKEEMENL